MRWAMSADDEDFPLPTHPWPKHEMSNYALLPRLTNSEHDPVLPGGTMIVSEEVAQLASDLCGTGMAAIPEGHPVPPVYVHQAQRLADLGYGKTEPIRKAIRTQLAAAENKLAWFIDWFTDGYDVEVEGRSPTFEMCQDRAIMERNERVRLSDKLAAAERRAEAMATAIREFRTKWPGYSGAFDKVMPLALLTAPASQGDKP